MASSKACWKIFFTEVEKIMNDVITTEKEKDEKQ